MNKKLVLSVLSTALVASMASAAMAKPSAGIYIGGDVDKYYGVDAFLDNFDAALDEILDNLNDSVFVDGNANAAKLSDALSADDINSVLKPATKADFEANPYAIVDGTGSYDPTTDAELPGGDVPGELKVESVSAINAKTIEVKFSKAVDADTVIGTVGTDDTLEDNVFTITRIPAAGDVRDVVANTAVAELSEDGKTLTIVAAGTEYFSGDYAVTIANTVTDEDGNSLEAYSGTVKVSDTTRPTLSKVSYVDNETAVIYFSEPLASEGTVTFTNADGSTNAAATYTFNAGDDFIEVDLSALAATDFNKDITVNVVGAKDYAGNLVSPNPFKQVVKKSTLDTTAPEVASIVATSNKTFTVKFSEELVAVPTIAAVGGQAATAVKDSTDPTKYNVTLAGAVSGLQTVTISTFADKSNNPGASYSKVVNFDVDSNDPVVSSTKVEKINGVEYLVVTFNENVATVDAKTIAASFVKDSITTDVTLEAEVSGGVTGGNIAVPVSLYNPVSGKSSSLKFDLTLLSDGVYTAELPAGLAKDVNGNDSVAKSVSFTRTSDTAVDKPELDATQDAGQGAPYTAGNGVLVSTTDNNKVSVFFDTKVDTASALNKANYQIEGATVANAVLRSNTAAGAEVELTLTADSNSFSGLRTVTISGVKSEGGAVMTAVNTTEHLTENVRPTVVKAELTDTDEITLTFSEAMDVNSIDDTADGGNVDLAVYVGDVKVTAAIAEALVAASGDKKFTITVTGGFSSADLAKGIVVKPAADFAGKDAQGNKANFTSVTVAQ